MFGFLRAQTLSQFYGDMSHLNLNIDTDAQKEMFLFKPSLMQSNHSGNNLSKYWITFILV